MNYYKELNQQVIHSLNLTTYKDNKKVEYYNIEAGFDIETSSVYNQDKKSAFMYAWMFGIKHGEPVYYGRTWEEFLDLYYLLVNNLDLSKNKRLIIYVHNLSYEFQFMRKYFEWESVFSIDERKPIKALTKEGIEFRDSYILSGYSLAKTAENLNYHKIEKMVGDLDYDLVRHSTTQLTPLELGYMENDIKIITAYINEQIYQYENITLIPLTNTGRVRDYVRKNCYYEKDKSRKKSSKGKYIRYRKIMQDLTLEENEYKLAKRSFMGGFTHANARYVGEVLENVTSVDFTSSYPSVMLAEQYPMSSGFDPQIESMEDFKIALSKYCLIFDVEFYNLRPRIKQENYLSESKCYELEKPIINNGRIVSAERVLTTITNVDYNIMEHAYQWDNIRLFNIKAYHKSYLPKPIIESVLELYQGKTELKGVEGKEVEYLLSKGMLNSIYGMTVTDIVKDEHIYLEEWGVEPANLTESIEKYNESRNRFLFYPWGIFVTAYARRNLWSGILSLGDDYIYSDTDSIKLLNYQDNLEYFNAYNENTKQKLYAMCDYYKLDKKLLSPKTIKNVEKFIGIWDFEGTYKRFKTLGAKRYLLENDDDSMELTVAGLSKQNGLNYLKEISNNDNTKVFDLFNDDMYIPADKTGKMTHTYIDSEMSFKVVDYQGTEQHVNSLSSIHLEPCDFTLSISKQFETFLRALGKGYVFKGVKYV